MDDETIASQSTVTVTVLPEGLGARTAQEPKPPSIAVLTTTGSIWARAD